MVSTSDDVLARASSAAVLRRSSVDIPQSADQPTVVVKVKLGLPVTHRTLIVARMDPSDASTVADIFGESDVGELPHRLGVTRRTLFEFHGLYFHLVESAGDVGERLRSRRDDPLFVDVNQKLESYVSAYDPHTWRGPRDAMARPFYSWPPD